MIEIKRCSKCNETKHISEFNKNKSKKDGYSDYCKKCCNVYNKKYSDLNKDKIKEYAYTNRDKRKEYYEENRERLIKYNKMYYNKNRLVLIEKAKEYSVKNSQKIKSRYYKNREEILKRAKEYRTLNKDRIKSYMSEYMIKNKTFLNRKSIEYNKINAEKINEYKRTNYLKIREKRKIYFRNRRMCDVLFKISGSIRSRVSKSFKVKRWNKNNKTKDILGCEYMFAIRHIESLFSEGMSWKNHGEWHIDHIIPLSSAKTKDELIKLCHYTNLQPLWAKDNLIKGNKILFYQ